MRRVGAYEAKAKLSSLLEAVEKNRETIIITKNDRPVAELRPVGAPSERAIDRAIERLAAIRKRSKLKGISIRTLIETGRRY